MTPETLIDQWRRGLRIGQNAHYEAAKHYHRLHMALSIPTVLISALLSTAVFSTLQNSSDAQVKMLMAVLSVLTVVLTSLQAALRLAERSERHKTAAVQLGEVRRELEQQLVFEHRDEPTIAKLRERWNAEDRQAPTVPSRLYKRALDEVMALGDRPQAVAAPQVKT